MSPLLESPRPSRLLLGASPLLLAVPDDWSLLLDSDAGPSDLFPAS